MQEDKYTKEEISALQALREAASDAVLIYDSKFITEGKVKNANKTLQDNGIAKEGLIRIMSVAGEENNQKTNHKVMVPFSTFNSLREIYNKTKNESVEGIRAVLNHNYLKVYLQVPAKNMSNSVIDNIRDNVTKLGDLSFEVNDKVKNSSFTMVLGSYNFLMNNLNSQYSDVPAVKVIPSIGHICTVDNNINAANDKAEVTSR